MIAVKVGSRFRLIVYYNDKQKVSFMWKHKWKELSKRIIVVVVLCAVSHCLTWKLNFMKTVLFDMTIKLHENCPLLTKLINKNGNPILIYWTDCARCKQIEQYEIKLYLCCSFTKMKLEPNTFISTTTIFVIYTWYTLHKYTTFDKSAL